MYTLKRNGKNHEGQPFKIHISEGDKSLCRRIKADKHWKVRFCNDYFFNNRKVFDDSGKNITDQYCRACLKIYTGDNLIEWVNET
jgi:hypothetical protein